KECAKNSIGIYSEVETIQIKHLVSQIMLIKEQIAEIDKKIEEFSIKNNSPILMISHFSGTSILAELGDIGNYSKPSQIIKFAGVAPYHYESSQYNAGKGHRCAQGHCIRKLLRIIYHLLETGQSFDPALLR
ncbi:transposase, partial [Holdemanella biformis]|uniref:transposase n=1 Tax=Holdemanella biformis TaxID=1735 RepID=UPI0022E8505F